MEQIDVELALGTVGEVDLNYHPQEHRWRLCRVRGFPRIRVPIFRDKLDEDPLSALRPGGNVSNASWLDTLARGF